MEIFWKLFYATGDPLTYMLYRDEQTRSSTEPPEPSENSEEPKEATLWPPPPTS